MNNSINGNAFRTGNIGAAQRTNNAPAQPATQPTAKAATIGADVRVTGAAAAQAVGGDAQQAIINAEKLLARAWQFATKG